MSAPVESSTEVAHVRLALAALFMAIRQAQAQPVSRDYRAENSVADADALLKALNSPPQVD